MRLECQRAGAPLGSSTHLLADFVGRLRALVLCAQPTTPRVRSGSASALRHRIRSEEEANGSMCGVVVVGGSRTTLAEPFSHQRIVVPSAPVFITVASQNPSLVSGGQRTATISFSPGSLN